MAMPTGIALAEAGTRISKTTNLNGREELVIHCNFLGANLADDDTKTTFLQQLT